MNEILVSIRIPESLLNKVKKDTEKNHFMDVSENIRSVVRKKWFESLYPELNEIKRLRKDIFEELKKKNEQEISKKIISELDLIKKEIGKK